MKWCLNFTFILCIIVLLGIPEYCTAAKPCKDNNCQCRTDVMVNLFVNRGKVSVCVPNTCGYCENDEKPAPLNICSKEIEGQVCGSSRTCAKVAPNINACVPNQCSRDLSKCVVSSNN